MSIDNKTHPIQEAQILYTRRCNNNCSYCGLVHNNLEDITQDEWKKVIDNLSKLRINFLKIVGGEPMIKPEGVIDLIRYIKDKTKIIVTLASNSMWDKKYIRPLCKSKLSVYATTINTFDEQHSIDLLDFLKSQEAYQRLLNMRDKMGKVYADIVVSSKNLEDIPKIIKILFSDKIPVYLFPMMCGKCNTKYEARVKDTNFKLRKDDKGKIEDLMSKLVDMKNKGALILNTQTYLENMALYGVEGGSWKCTSPSELRIDADGAVMLCNDIRGEISNKLNLSKLITKDPGKWWDEYYRNWFSSREKTDCACYWPCFLNSTNTYLFPEENRLR